MPLLGQASGGWTESSSALRILNLGIRNSVGVLSNDSFTQTNPPVVTATSAISSNVDTSVLGALSGSVAMTRPDAGVNFIGPNAEGVGAANELFVMALGIFINDAVGNAYENTPGPASGKGPYVSGQGTYASALFETQFIGAPVAGAGNIGDTITYTTGMVLIASRNAYLMPGYDIVNGQTLIDATNCAEIEHGWVVGTDNLAATVMGILKMPADAVQPEIVFDLRV